MNVKQITMGIVATIVAIVIVVTCAIPIISDSVTTEDTFSNKGRYYITTQFEDEVTITMDYDIENNVRSWYIDGDLLVYDELTGPEYVSKPTVAGTDNYVFRIDGRYRGLNSSTGSSDYTITVTKDSITKGDFVGNAPIFIASVDETDSVMRYSPDVDAYLLGTSEILAVGYTNVAIGESDAQTSAVISFEGTIEDGVTVTAYGKDYEFTVSNVVINAEEVNGYENLYKYQSVTFDVTYNDGTTDYVTPCTYSMVVLPSEVTAERTVHPDSSVISILSVIPVMMVLAILIGAVTMFIKTRRD